MFEKDLSIVMDQSQIKNMSTFELKVIDSSNIFDEQSTTNQLYIPCILNCIYHSLQHNEGSREVGQRAPDL